PQGRPLPDRARLDRGPAVPAAPPHHQRADVRDRRPPPPDRRLRHPAVPQPRRRARARPHLSWPRGPAAPRRRRLAAGQAHDPGRRLGAPHPEPGDLPVNAATPEEQRRALAARQRGDAIEIANEFAEVRISRVETRNGSRLLIESPKSGQWVTLCPLEL